MTKRKFLLIASCVYCGCLIVSNIIAGKTFGVIGLSLPCAVIIFPIVYILNDVLTECFGYKTARMVVFTGFGVNLIAVAAYLCTIALPASPFFTEQDAFRTVLGSTPRLLLASLLAYICGSLLNAKVMQKMKEWNGRLLMLRCITSTLVGELIDASIFITIAFVGSMPFNALAIMVLTQGLFKTVYETVVYPLTRVVIRKVESLED